MPAFLTIAVMPFTYSIAYGLIAGIMSYLLLNTIPWLVKLATKGRVTPDEYETKEYWTYKIEGGILPPWLMRLMSGKKDFWTSGKDRTVPGDVEGTEPELIKNGKDLDAPSANSKEAPSHEVEKDGVHSPVTEMPKKGDDHMI